MQGSCHDEYLCFRIVTFELLSGLSYSGCDGVVYDRAEVSHV